MMQSLRKICAAVIGIQTMLLFVNYVLQTRLGYDALESQRHSSIWSNKSTDDTIPIRENKNSLEFDNLNHCEPLTNDYQFKFQSIGDHYVYTAYFDDRFPKQSAIRIFTLGLRTHHHDMTPYFFCHIPINEKKSSKYNYRSVPAIGYEMSEHHEKLYGGLIVSCLLQPSSQPPCHVLISKNRMSPFSTNISAVRLPVLVRRQNVRHDLQTSVPTFAVCIPPMFGDINTTNLVEFIELSRILGAHHLVFYPYKVSSEITQILNYYTGTGIVTAVPWDIPSSGMDVWYHGQQVAVNDCLYRTMYAFELVVFNDLDEFIVPHQGNTWTEMINIIDQISGVTSSQKYCGYSFLSAFFDPRYTGFPDNVTYNILTDKRTEIFSQVRKKVMVRPELIFELGIHHISRPVSLNQSIMFVDPNFGFLHHYRQCDIEYDEHMNCERSVYDGQMLMHVDRLKANTQKQRTKLKELGVFN